MTLDEWYAVWMETCKKNCRDTTKRTYEIQYNRLREELGWRELSKLNLVIVQKAFNGLKFEKRCLQRGLALLIDMLSRAMETDMLNKNPTLKVKGRIDNKETERKRVLTEDEIQILYEFSKVGRLYPFFVVALNTGMRIGEILGLHGIVSILKTT